MSPGTASVVSTGAISVGSSKLVSGIILSPVVLPVALVMHSVEKMKRLALVLFLGLQSAR